MAAAIGSFIQIVWLLLKNNADVNAKSKFGDTGQVFSIRVLNSLANFQSL